MWPSIRAVLLRPHTIVVLALLFLVTDALLSIFSPASAVTHPEGRACDIAPSSDGTCVKMRRSLGRQHGVHLAPSRSPATVGSATRPAALGLYLRVRMTEVPGLDLPARTHQLLRQHLLTRQHGLVFGGQHFVRQPL